MMTMRFESSIKSNSKAIKWIVAADRYYVEQIFYVQVLEDDSCRATKTIVASSPIADSSGHAVVLVRAMKADYYNTDSK